MPKPTPAQMKAAVEEFKKRFTPGFYHGSPNPNIKAFDPMKSTVRDVDFVTPGVTFVTKSPKFADSFTAGKGPYISLKTGEAIPLGSYNKGSTMYPVSVDMANHFDPMSPEGRLLIEAYVAKKYADDPKMARQFKSRIEDPHSNWTTMESPAFLQHLRESGIKTFDVNESGYQNVGVLDPSKIRGKFAKYNPEDAESPDFMKAEGGLVHLAGGGVPKNVVKAYKLFRTKKNDPETLYPLFVNANKPVPMNEWVTAEVGPVAASGKVKSKLGELAYRPGWHAGDLPIATHIGGKSQPGLKAPDYRRPGEVWAEVEMPADVNWQDIANQRARLNKAGKIIPSTAHITDEIPLGGHYRYKTSPNMEGNWLIGGEMKVNRVLTDEEVQAINEAAGRADLPRFMPFDEKAAGGLVGYAPGGSVFNPEGAGYDYQTAMAYGMGPTGTGEDLGHWGSVAPTSDDERMLRDLPRDAYVMLKGKAHETFDKAKAAEKERGSKVVKIGDRYYSIPVKKAAE